jgi:hypothetical protein
MRFRSTWTGLEIELLAELDRGTDKGAKWEARVLKPGETQFKRGERTSTFEATLADDFMEIVEAAPQPVEMPELLIPGENPWATWPVPLVIQGRLQEFHVALGDGPRDLQLWKNERRLGRVTGEGLEQLGRRCGFPPDFIVKLLPSTQQTVINERILNGPVSDVTVLIEKEQFVAIVPAWRGVLPLSMTAEIAYRKLLAFYPQIEIEEAEQDEGYASIRLMTPVAYPLTETPGDVLRLGVQVQQKYGGTIRVSLFCRALANGKEVAGDWKEFSWRQRSNDAGSSKAQLEWLEQAVMDVLCEYIAMVEEVKNAARS